MTVEDESGSISPSGRFARMEAALERIEAKLDLKADAAEVAELRAQLGEHKQYVSDLVTGKIVSPQQADYLRRWNEMEQAIDHLKEQDSNRRAVMASQEKSQDIRYRSLLWVVGIATLLNITFNIAMMWLRAQGA